MNEYTLHEYDLIFVDGGYELREADSGRYVTDFPVLDDHEPSHEGCHICYFPTPEDLEDLAYEIDWYENVVLPARRNAEKARENEV